MTLCQVSVVVIETSIEKAAHKMEWLKNAQERGSKE